VSRAGERLERPSLPAGYDDSRAGERRGDPAGWRFSAGEREAVWRVLAERRDIRRFRPDPLPDGMLRRLLEAAHSAPSVGLMQPWRFVVVESERTKAAMQALAARERLVQSERFDERTRQFLDLKIEGIREAPVSLCVCCDREAGGREVLGRHTIRDTDLYSTCLAIENLWLAARAEGIGVGWVSFYRPDDVRALLGLPEHVVPVAWLCVGYPDERPSRPGLEAAGWGRRRPLDELVFAERWGEPPAASAVDELAAPAVGASRPRQLPGWWRRLAVDVRPGDTAAVVRVRDASDKLIKPAGSLGGLESLVERFALATGAPPPPEPRAGILVLAADHGIATRGVSLYPRRVSAQVAAAAARGETAIGVLSRALGAELVIADVGLAGPKREGLVDRRVAEGSDDIAGGPALTPETLRAAVEAGHALAAELAERCDLLVLGEIGIGNTTVASALLAALTGLPPAAVCGRGTGLDAQGLERKRSLVAAALAASTPERDYLIAGHRSAEPAHERVLVELGLEPLLDLRLRLGEGSGAALALPLVGLAGRLHAEMRHFDQAGVDRATDEVEA